VAAGGGQDKPPTHFSLTFGAMEGQWWVVMGDTRPLLMFGAMEGWWGVVVGETSPLLAFGAMEGWWWVR
jgi:hypothetical protein